MNTADVMIEDLISELLREVEEDETMPRSKSRWHDSVLDFLVQGVEAQK